MLPRLLAPFLALAAVGAPVSPAPTAPTDIAVVSSEGVLRSESINTQPGRIYQFGSVSKTITAAAVEDAGIAPTTPVEVVLPSLRDTELAHRGTTIADLLAHTSGLPHDVTVTDHHRSDRASDILPEVAALPLGDHGTYRYSSLNYLLLQAVLEERFPDAAPTTPGLVTDGDVPAGSAPFLTWRVPLAARHDAAGLGYGYLAGDITTLGDFASRQLAAPSAAWREETMLIDAGTGATGATEVTAYRHSGAVPGYFAHVTLVPERDRAVVLLTAYYGELDAHRLNAWADNVVRTELGGRAEPLPAPSRVSLWLMMACVVPLLALLLRPRRWAVAAAVVVAVGSVILPYVLGYPLHHLWPWAPDVAAAVILWSLLWLLTAGITEYRRRGRR
ncbi:serine hydrolase [Corynebacterium sp.]|uniref:serine hydrolase domain-containing protein n=1 Tax=Corynebacterium sp. TaxID=1720 RepID=UPI0026E07783|nr:serine hydrolase domain-containing protein [Corynebacterium sp.]MDO5511593.1 serine hydrolase domain-containing protein [Corynebacterium sp.]